MSVLWCTLYIARKAVRQIGMQAPWVSLCEWPAVGCCLPESEVSTPGFVWRWGSMECWGDWGQLIWVQSWSLAQPQLCCKEPEEPLASVTHQRKKSTLCSLSCSGLDVSQQHEVLDFFPLNKPHSFHVICWCIIQNSWNWVNMTSKIIFFSFIAEECYFICSSEIGICVPLAELYICWLL